MNGDIRPPRRSGPRSDFPMPQAPPTPRPSAPPPAVPARDTRPSAPQPLQPTTWSNQPSNELPPPVKTPPPPHRKERRWPWVIVGLLILIVGLIAVAGMWYFSALSPVKPGETDTQKVTVAAGSAPSIIARQLHDEGLIRSAEAFLIYVRLQGAQGSLQEGSYNLSPSQSTQEIVAQLIEGKTTQLSIMFYPGATLYDPTDTEDAKRTDVYTMLRRAGFSDEEVRAGLEKSYDHPLLAGKPAEASLEGYILGETYQFNGNSTVEQVLKHVFDVFYERIQQVGILAKLETVDMTLYQAITLASIIEREVSGQLEDQRKVSQIFHKRMAVGEPLGADATFMYAAQQRNVTPTISIDSLYNTRIHKGLPPGPIAVPDMVALRAAVDPADTDYLFFVSGDDGKNHFARTNAEHEANTRRYCTTLCNEIAD